MKNAQRRERAGKGGATKTVLPAGLTTAILESISEGVFTVDRAWRVTSFNRAAERITGIPRREAIGRPCAEVFRSNMCETACALRATLETGKPVGKTGYIVTAAGERVPISITTSVLRDARGRVIGGAETFRDLSEVTALRDELAGRVRVGALASRSPLMQVFLTSCPRRCGCCACCKNEPMRRWARHGPERTDARIIAATNTDLAGAMRRGAFREDLYYRLNVVRIELPPLRRRAEDIPLLVAHFIERFNRLHGKAVQGIAPEGLALLMGHDWPGNVRELENYIERAFVLCQGVELTLADLPTELRGARTREPAVTLRAVRAASEAHVIQHAIARCGGNRTAAARVLGMHKTTLHRKIRQLGITHAVFNHAGYWPCVMALTGHNTTAPGTASWRSCTLLVNRQNGHGVMVAQHREFKIPSLAPWCHICECRRAVFLNASGARPEMIEDDQSMQD